MLPFDLGYSGLFVGDENLYVSSWGALLMLNNTDYSQRKLTWWAFAGFIGVWRYGGTGVRNYSMAGDYCLAPTFKTNRLTN